MATLIRSAVLGSVPRGIAHLAGRWRTWRLRRQRITAIAELPDYLRRDIGWREPVVSLDKTHPISEINATRVRS